jgi:ribosomal protein S18 acetylase RimI-like enzyme
MDIRLATPNDAESIAALNAEVQQVHADALPHLFKPPSEETFPASLVRQLLAEPNTYIFIASENGAPVGYIYAQIIRRAETSLRYAWDRLYIHHLSVNQAAQRQGVGQSLIQAVVRVAKAHGIATIALDVWALNTKARSFFAAQGFTVYQETMWLHLSGQE